MKCKVNILAHPCLALQPNFGDETFGITVLVYAESLFFRPFSHCGQGLRRII